MVGSGILKGRRQPLRKTNPTNIFRDEDFLRTANDRLDPEQLTYVNAQRAEVGIGSVSVTKQADSTTKDVTPQQTHSQNQDATVITENASGRTFFRDLCRIFSRRSPRVVSCDVDPPSYASAMAPKNDGAKKQHIQACDDVKTPEKVMAPYVGDISLYQDKGCFTTKAL